MSSIFVITSRTVLASAYVNKINTSRVKILTHLLKMSEYVYVAVVVVEATAGFSLVTRHPPTLTQTQILNHFTRDLTDSKSASESNGIWHFSRNPKSVGYLKSLCNGFKIVVLVQLYNYYRK